MKFELALLAMCAALLCVSCSGRRCGQRPTVSVAGAEEQVVGAKYVEQLVFGGKCKAKLTYDEDGKLANVDTDPPCYRGEAVRGLSVNGEPLMENTGAITFGTATSRCYGPPVPSPPICICTKKPCP